LIEGEGFHAEEDDIVGGVNLIGGYGLRLDCQVALRADDADAVVLELLRALRANEKGDIAACLGEIGSEVASDSAGTNNKNPHERSPEGLMTEWG
jgi:hypothetical protein